MIRRNDSSASSVSLAEFGHLEEMLSMEERQTGGKIAYIFLAQKRSFVEIGKFHDHVLFKEKIMGHSKRKDSNVSLAEFGHLEEMLTMDDKLSDVNIGQNLKAQKQLSINI